MNNWGEPTQEENGYWHLVLKNDDSVYEPPEMRMRPDEITVEEATSLASRYGYQQFEILHAQVTSIQCQQK